MSLLILLSCNFDFKLFVSQGLTGYKSRLHLSKRPEGVAQQAALKEAVDGPKKKRAEKA